MGYFTAEDIPYPHALADAFTLCDHSFCSVIGPTTPNRMYSMTGTIDPDGLGGGPVFENFEDFKKLHPAFANFIHRDGARLEKAGGP